MSAEFVTVVSGLPRSGTSLMMQMLAAGGYALLVDGVRGADDNNPRGYFELEAVKKLRTERTWLENARGRAVKVIHALVASLPTDGRFQFRVIVMERPTGEVLASQRAMLASYGKASADEATLSRVYEAQLADLKCWLGAQPHFSWISVNHRRLIEQPLEVAEDVANFLSADLNVTTMGSVVDPLLYRQRGNGDKPSSLRLK